MKSLLRYGFILYVLVMLPAFFLPVPAVPVPNLPGGFDKWVHVGIFFGFAVLLQLDRRLRPWRTLLIAFAFAAGVELVQTQLPYRSGDFWDFFAGAIGATAGVGVALVVATAGLGRSGR